MIYEQKNVTVLRYRNYAFWEKELLARFYSYLMIIIAQNKAFHQLSRSTNKYFLAPDKLCRNAFKVCTKV